MIVCLLVLMDEDIVLGFSKEVEFEFWVLVIEVYECSKIFLVVLDLIEVIFFWMD